MENKKIEEIKNRTITINKIQVIYGKDSPESSEIEKIIIISDVGEITHKPKIMRTHKEQGFEVLQVCKATIEEIHPTLKEIAKKTFEAGQCNVFADYTTMTVDNDGEPKTYRFVKAPKVFDYWRINGGENQSQ